MYSVRFDTKKIKNLRVGAKLITSFVVREVDGADEEIAANTAKGKGGAATNAEELVRMSIVEVNGDAVKHPYLAFDTWNSRARTFALKAFRSLNSAEEEELDGFLAAAEPAEGGPSQVTSGAAAREID